MTLWSVSFTRTSWWTIVSDSILSVFKSDDYTLGACSVRVYDRSRRDIYGDNFLYKLWCDTLNSSHPPGTSDVLKRVFCGMDDVSSDAICAYLHSRIPLLLLCVNYPSPKPFDVIGYVFPSVYLGTPKTERALLAGYCFFKPWWGTPESTVLGMLSIGYLFHELNLQALHGQRYATNVLTARYMNQFGSRDVGRIPKFIVSEGKLQDCIVSTLLREDFEAYCERQLLSLAGEAITNGQTVDRRGPGSPAR